MKEGKESEKRVWIFSPFWFSRFYLLPVFPTIAEEPELRTLFKVSIYLFQLIETQVDGGTWP